MPSYKKVNGKVNVIFDVPSENGKRKQKRLSSFKNVREAELAYLAYIGSVEQRIRKKPASLKFEEVYKNYMSVQIHAVKVSTYAGFVGTFKKHILPYFEDFDISNIKTQDINNWLMEINNLDLSYNTKIKIKSNLSKLFEFCIESEIIETNPCLKSFKLKNYEIKKEMDIWGAEDFTKFINVVDNLEHKVFFSFLYLTGCRRGEAFALTWNDIKGDIVTINKTLGYHRLDGGYLISTPKNTYSNRNIVMPNNLSSLMQQLKEYYKQYNEFSNKNFVFGNLRPIPPETLRRNLSKYCEKADVKLIRIHDFRHSHASLLISKGHDIVTISRRLGHGNIEMTLNTYAHLMPNKQHELMSSLNIDI